MYLEFKNEKPKLGFKAGILGDAHAGPFKGNIKGYLTWFPERYSRVNLSISAGAGFTLGIGIPDWIPLSGDIEASGLFEGVYTFKYDFEDDRWEREGDINLLIKGEAASNLSFVAFGEAGLAADVVAVLNKKQLRFDILGDLNTGLQIPLNLGQLIIKLGIEIKGVFHIQTFYRWTCRVRY